MSKDERFLPLQITRFNYWTLEIASPKPQHQLTPTVQRLGEFPEVTWIDRPGHTALHRHIQQDFQLLLHAPPDIWAEQVFPVHHVKFADIPNRQVYALKYYVECDKEWEQDPEAQRVLKQLSPRQRTALRRLSSATWPTRSKRPARLKRTWIALMNDIARDQDIFERFCETPPESDQLSGTEKRIYLNYSKQAIKLLGGGTYIPKARRNIYRDLLDGSTLLTSSGRLPSQSIFTIDWLKLSPTERREAKQLTLHWFHHALRNLREYRYGRPEVPWSSKCENKCRQVQEKLRAL